MEAVKKTRTVSIISILVYVIIVTMLKRISMLKIYITTENLITQTTAEEVSIHS